MASHSSQRVAIAGATGNVGLPILKHLLEAGHKVTVFTREGSTSTSKLDTSNKNLTIEEVDYTSVSSLTKALEKNNIETVVSCLGSTSINEQQPLIEASLATGQVTRFIPSEFGTDTSHPKTAKLPVFAGKVAVAKFLESKVTDDSKLSYTLIMTGPFFDWGLRVGFFLNPVKHSGTIYDGGDRPFSTSTLDTIGKAVVAVLAHLEETKNKVIRVADATVTQNQLIKITEKLDGQKWTDLTYVQSEEVEKESYAELKKDKPNFQKAMYGFLFRGVVGEGYSGNYQGKEDNKLLGLDFFTEKQIEDLVKSILDGK